MGDTEIRGTEKIVVFNKKIPSMTFSDYPELEDLASRWTSKNLQNYFLRFNSPMSKEDLKRKMASIVNISEDMLEIYDTPFLWN